MNLAGLGTAGARVIGVMSRTYYSDRQGLLDWHLEKTQAIQNGLVTTNDNKDD